MIVQNHIITPKNGLNVVGCIDDSIAGNYLLTKNLNYDKEKAVAILTSIGFYNSEAFKKFSKKVSGKEIFSALIPADFDFVGYSKAYKDDPKEENIVKIKKGKLISGVIDKATIGTENGSLIRSLYAKYGEDERRYGGCCRRTEYIASRCRAGFSIARCWPCPCYRKYAGCLRHQTR